MKFPYIPLDSIIDEVVSDLRRMNRQGLIDKDICYRHGVDQAQMIGGNNYEQCRELIAIKNHIGLLPLNFYTANEAFKLEVIPHENNNIMDAFKHGDDNYRRVGKMFQGMESVMVVDNMASYIIKRPPGTIRASFRTGFMLLDYNGLPVNEDGIIMIQDEVNTIRCISYYIKLRVMEEPFYNGEIPQYVYNDIKENYVVYESQAKGIQKYPDPSSIEKTMDEINNRYTGFKLR